MAPTVDEWIEHSDTEDMEPFEPNSQPPFFHWEDVFPFLNVMLENAQQIALEAQKLEYMLRYTPWPESNLYNRRDQNGDWKVVPLLYTFPATDPKASKWVQANCEQCPLTTRLLQGIPGIRTALFSRMGPMTRLASHRGWADLANYVLRCHLPLKVPKTPSTDCCGMWVEGHRKPHRLGEIIVFDDSRTHKAYNASPSEDRVVLIFDIIRPPHIPLGMAKAGHTDALDSFINDFELAMSRFAQ